MTSLRLPVWCGPLISILPAGSNHLRDGRHLDHTLSFSGWVDLARQSQPPHIGGWRGP